MSIHAEKKSLKQKSLGTAVKVIFGIIAVSLLIYALVNKWGSFTSAVSQLSTVTIIFAFLTAFIANSFNGLSWWQAYRALNMRFPVTEALGVFWVSQIGKYIPGSVWPVLTQMEMAKERGYSRTRAFTASVVAMIVPVVTAGTISTVLLVIRTPEAIQTYWYVLAAVPIGILILIPPVLRRILSFLSRLTHKNLDTSQLEGKGIVFSVLWSLAVWSAYGIHSVLILDGLTTTPVSPMLATGAFALSWVAGFLFIPAPAGVGVREAVLILILGSALLPDDAFAFAIISRVMLIGVDAISALIGFLIGWYRRRTDIVAGL